MLRRLAAFSETVMPELLLLLLLSVAFASGISDNIDFLDDFSAAFSPKEPLFASGTTMVLNCTLKNAPPGVTAHQVQCTFDGSNLTVVVLSNSTVQIGRENVTRQMSHGHVFCHLNVMGMLKPLGQVAIRVADIPVAPNITGCVVYNWEQMVCTWALPKQDTGLPTNYSLGWTLLSCGKDLNGCPNWSGNTCVWKGPGRDRFMMDMTYKMTMYAQNELRNVSSQCFDFHTTDLVKPDPVKNLQTSNITSQSAYLEWIWVIKDGESKPLLYRINYSSKWNNETKETTANYTTLTSLVPNTEYRISVECLSYPDSVPRGFWSDEAVIELHTAEDVPGQAPSIADGSYYSWISDAGRTVEVFWQRVPERWAHGNLQHFRIRCFNYWNRSHIVAEHLEHGTRSELQVPMGLDVGVTVEAETTKGYNDSLELETLVIPRADLVPAKPDMFRVVRNLSEITAIWSLVSNATGYTVYWCKKAGHGRCETWLNWKSVSANVTNLTIPVGIVKHDEYLVAVSMETYLSVLDHTVSSGMTWAACVPDVTKRAKPPEHVAFTKDQQAFSLTIEWSKPKCEETAYIVNFEILYCQRQSCDEDDCCVNNKTMVVRKSETKAVIGGLEADVEYDVAVRSLSFTENSAYTPPIRRRVIRSGLTGGVIAAIVIAALVLLLLLVVGLVTIAKKIKKYFYCCQKITIVSPPTVVRMPLNSGEQAETNPVVQFYRDGFDVTAQTEERKSLLSDTEGAKQDADAGTATVVIRGENGENHRRSNTMELLQPLMNGSDVARLGRDELGDSGVPQSHDSSISSYTHLAVPDESALKEPNGFVENGRAGGVSSDRSSGILPRIADNDPHSQTSHVAEPRVSENAPTNVTESYMPVEKIPLPLSSSSSSAIAPYTTVEQTFEMAEPKNLPESSGYLPADARADVAQQVEPPADDCRSTVPGDYRHVECPIDSYISGALAGISNVADRSPISTELTAGVKPLYANHRTPDSEDGYSDQYNTAVTTK